MCANCCQHNEKNVNDDRMIQQGYTTGICPDPFYGRVNNFFGSRQNGICWSLTRATSPYPKYPHHQMDNIGV